MRYLVDTYGWIEWLTDGKLASSFEPYLKHLSELMVPTLIQYELYKWISREKDTTLALEVIGITENCEIVPLDTALALICCRYFKRI
jgi:predicted nucleic acid-binding protein